MTTYKQGRGYITNLEAIEIENIHPGIVLNSLVMFTKKHDPDFHQFICDMADINMMSNVVCPCLVEVDDSEILKYSGHVIDGEAELLK